MKKTNIITKILFMSLCLWMCSTSVYATPEEDEQVQQEETTNDSSLTPEGNLTLIDEIENNEKQYLTVMTKDGNYFYIIIDYSNGEENVHFLNQVDEVDLLALMEDAPIDTYDATTPQEEDSFDEVIEQSASQESVYENQSIVLIIGVSVVVIIGLLIYYFKIVKSKNNKQEESGFEYEEDYLLDKEYPEDDRIFEDESL